MTMLKQCLLIGTFRHNTFNTLKYLITNLKTQFAVLLYSPKTAFTEWENLSF